MTIFTELEYKVHDTSGGSQELPKDEETLAKIPQLQIPIQKVEHTIQSLIQVQNDKKQQIEIEAATAAKEKKKELGILVTGRGAEEQEELDSFLKGL
jgi:hypothetical protein